MRRSGPLAHVGLDVSRAHTSLSCFETVRWRSVMLALKATGALRQELLQPVQLLPQAPCIDGPIAVHSLSLCTEPPPPRSGQRRELAGSRSIRVRMTFSPDCQQTVPQPQLLIFPIQQQNAEDQVFVCPE